MSDFRDYPSQTISPCPPPPPTPTPHLPLHCNPVISGVATQVAQARNMSIGEHRHCCVIFKIYGFVWEKNHIVSVTYENKRISIKNSLPYLKCVLHLSCVVHRPINGRFMGLYVNGFLLYIERENRLHKNP